MYVTNADIRNLSDADDDTWINRVAVPIATNVVHALASGGLGVGVRVRVESDVDDAIAAATVACWQARKHLSGKNDFSYLTQAARFAALNAWRRVARWRQADACVLVGVIEGAIDATGREVVSQ